MSVSSSLYQLTVRSETLDMFCLSAKMQIGAWVWKILRKNYKTVSFIHGHIRGLNLAAVGRTTVQVSKLALYPEVLVKHNLLYRASTERELVYTLQAMYKYITFQVGVVSNLRQWNMVMSPAGLGLKNICAAEALQQL
jgi:hypothetical protein